MLWEIRLAREPPKSALISASSSSSIVSASSVLRVNTPARLSDRPPLDRDRPSFSRSNNVGGGGASPNVLMRSRQSDKCPLRLSRVTRRLFQAERRPQNEHGQSRQSGQLFWFQPELPGDFRRATGAAPTTHLRLWCANAQRVL